MESDNTRILLVDDEEDILEFLNYNLTKAGYQVDTAENGKTALQKTAKTPYDLIILDIMMPEMDGVEVCREIRNQETNRDSLIAFLTARSEDFTQIAALDSGGDDFITKPIKPGVFLSRIQALLRRKKRSEDDDAGLVLTFGDLRIDKEKLEVYERDELIHLAKKEFELLYLLVSKPGKVFNRDEILQKVWGSDVIVTNRTVDVHIRKLREKIGDDYIKTIKGVGYKFDY
ncbi:MAG: response regulator transcription factor [Saprospiraceae bacterium]|nr:response regulator transcription factor [Saprospiraceae bacterium]MCB9318817.1 response regulator transcription factor [Lewinellaceae bacterium]